MSQTEQQPLSPDFTSPHKSARGADGGDVTRNPHIRTESERPSPGPNRKVSGSGSRTSTPRNEQDVFSAPNQVTGDYVLGTAPTPRAHTGLSEPGSPSPSSRGGLDTGHHATDFEGSEEGEIRDNAPFNADGGEDDTMPLAAAMLDANSNTGMAAEPMAIDDEDENARRERDEDHTGQGNAPATPAPAPAAAGEARAHRPLLDGGTHRIGPGAHPHLRVPERRPSRGPRTSHPAGAPVPLPSARTGAAGRPPRPSSEPTRPASAFACGWTESRRFLPGPCASDGVTVAAANAALAAIENGAAGIVFVFPDLAEHARAPPTHLDESPHRLAPAVSLPEPTGPDDLNLTKIQPNTGNFPQPVISADRLHENVDELTLQHFRDSPGSYLYAVPFNGGVRMRKQLGGGRGTAEGDKVIADALTKGIASLVNPVTTSVFPVLEKKTATGGNYAGTIILAIAVDNPEDRTRLIDQTIIAIDRTFAFWIVPPERTTLPWVIAILSPTIGGGTVGAERAIRATMSKFIWTDNAIGLALARLTSNTDKSPLDVRRYKLSQSLHSVYNELTKEYAVYLKPCTTDATKWREFAAIFQRQRFSDGRYIFESRINPDMELERPGPRCVTCKHEDHYEPGCGPAKHKDFWGPTG
ncbi:hypothetical protein MSAN_02482400 [Mycena sanguinolenta]|uniref:Uncharacterized protein n=1 Tax=Mycena sanguinolenta TaxID=230812 RepID=A0A8H6U3T4_9AGAR|nr:hypothetical protein MSAN_02482400 [Mycena sanguinolenta]